MAEENNNLNRRKFLEKSGKFIVAGVCSTALAQILSSCETYSPLETTAGIDKVVNIDTDLTFPPPLTRQLFDKKGFGAKIRFSDVNYGIPVILVRIDADNIYCFSSLCTHDNCFGDDVSVPKGYYDTPSLSSYRLINCACHGSQYDPFQGGKVVTGPAEKALKQFPTKYDKVTHLLTISF